jgi:hypothetical protein
MPQVNISLSDEIHNYLVEIAELTGITKSSLAAEYVRRGLYEDARNHKELLQLRKEVQQQPPMLAPQPQPEPQPDPPGKGKSGGTKGGK